MYADKVTKSMQKAIDETDRKRIKQINYNTEHGLNPQALNKSKTQILGQTKVIEDAYDMETMIEEQSNMAADPVVKYMNKDQIKKLLQETERKMKKAAKDEDFIEAARLRDEVFELSKML